jgi:hypothetical protein
MSIKNNAGLGALAAAGLTLPPELHVQSASAVGLGALLLWFVRAARRERRA